MSERELSPLIQRFIGEWLANPVQEGAGHAMERAGYGGKRARAYAHKMLQDPRVKAEIKRRLAPTLKRLEITKERVLEEIARVAFFDPRKFYREDGSLKAVTELDDDTAAALAGMDIEEAYEHFSKGQAKPVGQIKKIKLADKLRALELSARYLKLLTDRVELDVTDKIVERLAAARRRGK